MADSTPRREPAEDAGGGPGPGPTAGTPRWVKVAGIVAVALALLIAAMLVIGGGPGEHGPGRHTGSGDAGGEAPPSGATPEGRRPRSSEPGGHTPPIGVPEHGAQP